MPYTKNTHSSRVCISALISPCSTSASRKSQRPRLAAHRDSGGSFIRAQCGSGEFTVGVRRPGAVERSHEVVCGPRGSRRRRREWDGDVGPDSRASAVASNAHASVSRVEPGARVGAVHRRDRGGRLRPPTSLRRDRWELFTAPTAVASQAVWLAGSGRAVGVGAFFAVLVAVLYVSTTLAPPAQRLNVGRAPCGRGGRGGRMAVRCG